MYIEKKNNLHYFFQTTKNSADNVSLQILDVDPKTIRIAFHLNVTREMTEKICQKLIFVLQEIKN